MLVSIMAQVDHTSYVSSDCIRGVSAYILNHISAGVRGDGCGVNKGVYIGSIWPHLPRMIEQEQNGGECGQRRS
jgi:hypothetical protein